MQSTGNGLLGDRQQVTSRVQKADKFVRAVDKR
jgi:hypothetical protein